MISFYQLHKSVHIILIGNDDIHVQIREVLVYKLKALPVILLGPHIIVDNIAFPYAAQPQQKRCYYAGPVFSRRAVKHNSCL